MIHSSQAARGLIVTGQLGFWSVERRLAEISAQGDPLETLAATVDFGMFRPVLTKALGEKPRWKGGRPPFDPVLKFRMLVLQSLHGLSLEQTGYRVRDRLSWMRLGPEDRVPDANTARGISARRRSGSTKRAWSIRGAHPMQFPEVSR